MKLKKKNIAIIIIAIILIIFLILGIAVFKWYKKGLEPVAKTNSAKQVIRIEVPKGSGIAKISEILESNNIIKDAKIMKIYCKINNIENLQAGKYELDNSENMPTVIEHIVNGEIASDEIKITFIEGKNIRWYARAIANKTTNTEEDVFNLLEDEEYIDSLIEKYWFLTDEIKNDDIYYPLEGYLLPNTYNFENDEVSVKQIFNVILNYMDKCLSKYKDYFGDNLTVHQMLTLASMAELEGKSTEDREEIIGVFLNRIEKEMNLGSDVTTYYAFKVDMGERDLYKKEINTENPYNTRGPNMNGKLPIGPICNPSSDAIFSTLNYKETDNLYFVADKNGKVYFTKDNDEHLKMIQTLKNEGLWYEYK